VLNVLADTRSITSFAFLFTARAASRIPLIGPLGSKGISIACLLFGPRIPYFIPPFPHYSGESRNLKEALFSDYFRGIYDSNFTEKVILTIDNREDIDRGLIIQKLNEVGICVNERINDLASQVAKKGRLVRSRRNRSKPKKAITIEDNVFDLGNEL